MKVFSRRLSLTYAAGSVGAFLNSLAIWLCGVAGITSALGVHIAPALTKTFLYPRLVWGGLWGFLFLMPFFRKSPLFRGLIYSIPPTLVQLFVVFPHHLGQGSMGLGLGRLTPLLVVIFNAIWGVTASVLACLHHGREGQETTRAMSVGPLSARQVCFHAVNNNWFSV